MLKRILSIASVLLVSIFTYVGSANADTTGRNLQLSGGLGVFIISDEGDSGASFDLSLEPEYFFTEHTSLGVRVDFAIGDLDAMSLDGRFRYYFDFASRPRLNLYVGGALGYTFNFDGGDFGQVGIPVGFQYDITDHFKIGSEIAPYLLFNSDDAGFGLRLMPVVAKWEF